MTLTRNKPRPSLAESVAKPIYEGDLYAWALSQGELLRAGRLDEVDRENLAEEIEALARSQFDKLVSFVRLVVLHMLKCDHQPHALSRSWLISIATHRHHLEDVLVDNPSLKARWDEAVERAYKTARLEAANEIGAKVASLPKLCPYSADEIRHRPVPVDTNGR